MSDDLIKREDAIKAFAEETNGVNVKEAIKVVDAYLQIRECDEVWDSIRAIRDCLECAKDDIAEFVPSADRPNGEWLKFGLGRGTRILFCTNCERRIEVPLSQGNSNYDFCPNCGADMREREGE